MTIEELLISEFSVEEQRELARLLALEEQMEAAREANPIGFYKPLPAALDFHRSTALKRLDTGGNRSSKTYSGAAEAIFWLDGQSPYRHIPKGPLEGIISSLSYPVQQATILPIIEKLIPRSKFNLKWSRDEKYLEGPNGVAWFKSDEQGWESYQGRALNFFWLDEEHSFATYQQLLKRLKGGSILQSWYTMTAEPQKPFHWTYDELAVPARDREQIEVRHFKFDLEDNRISRNGHIADSEIDRLIAATPIEERPAVIHGEYVRRGGLMYPMWRDEHHLDKEMPLSWFLERVRGGHLTAFCWLDWGLRNPTAIGLVVEDSDDNCILIDEIYRPAEDTDDIKREYQKRFAVFRPTFVVADPSIWHNHADHDPEKTIAGRLLRDDKETGLVGMPLIEGDNDHISGFTAVRDMLSVHPKHGPKFKVQPRCTKFRWEIEGYVGEEWATRGELKNKKETAQEKNNHHMDGFRYFCLSTHRWIRPSWHTTPRCRRVNPVTGYMRPA